MFKISQHSKLFTLLSVAFSLCACQSSPHQQYADVVFKNGTVYTVDSNNSTAKLLAVTAGEISFVGEADATNLIGANTNVINLNGGMVLPGLIDGHLHPVRGASKELYDCNFPFTATPEEVQQAIAKCVSQQPDADWIVGGQWDSGFFERFDVASPRALLDQVSAGKAVLLKDDSLHNIWVNSRALELAGVTENTPNPDGGTILREPDGKPNGILLETAAKAMHEFRPPYTDAQQQAAVQKFVSDANAYGLTGAKTASSYRYELAAMQAIDKRGELTLHLATSMRSADGKRSAQLDYAELESARDSYSSDNINTNFVKIFLDGVPTPARTAAMLNAYLPSDQHPKNFSGGELLVNPEALAKDLIELDKRGFTVKMHAAGDRSVRVALDAIEAARKANGNTGLRHELAHAGYISPEDIPRFKQLDAVADLSPILWYPSPIMDAIYSAVGQERGQHYFPVRDLIDSGANLLAGSDWPAVSVNANPWVGIESLVTRQHPLGKSGGTLWQEQSISLAEAIRIYSFDGARALRKEQITGSLEVGKSADLIVLDKNLFNLPIEKISEVLPRQTWFKGKLVHQR